MLKDIYFGLTMIDQVQTFEELKSIVNKMLAVNVKNNAAYIKNLYKKFLKDVEDYPNDTFCIVQGINLGISITQGCYMQLW